MAGGLLRRPLRVPLSSGASSRGYPEPVHLKSKEDISGPVVQRKLEGESFLFFYTLKLVYLCPLLVDTPRRESSHLRRVVGEKDPFTQSLPSHVGVGDVPNDFSLYTWTWVHSDPTWDLRRKEAHWDYDDRPRGP